MAKRETNPWVAGLVILAGVGAWGYIMTSGVGGSASSSPNDRPSRADRHCKDTTRAFVMSQAFVEQSLRSPSTADFPTAVAPDVSVQHVGDCRHRVDAYVDAENGFGATIRQKYSALLTYSMDNDEWTLEELSMP